jgi:hypothetical protein
MCLDRSLVHVVEKRMFFQSENRDNRCDVLFELESYVRVKNKHFLMITILRPDMCVRVLARALRTATTPHQDNKPIQCNIIRGKCKLGLQLLFLL